MAIPFTAIEPRRPTFWRRLLGRRSRENAIIEVNNLLARADAVRDVLPEQLDWICAEHTVTMRDLSGRAERFYRDYLTHCFADHRLAAEELADLEHLKRILRIDSTSVAAIHDNVARQVFSLTVHEVLADGRIDPDERAFLDALQRELELSDRTARRIEDARVTNAGRQA